MGSLGQGWRCLVVAPPGFNEFKSILKGGVRTLEQEHMAFRSEGTVKAAVLARHRLGQLFVLAQQYGDPVPGQPGGF